MNIESHATATGGTPDAARLLIVDDDALITTTLAAILRQAGYAVAEATSPNLALELCAGQSFNLAIVDERMPQINGTALAVALRDDFNVPVVFLSAYSDPQLITAATRAGSLGFFLKPIDPARMLPALQNILARAHELRELRAREVQLKNALTNEREINTAVGILMERLRLPREEAFEALRRYARSQRQQVVKLAGELLLAASSSHQLVASIAAYRAQNGDPSAANSGRSKSGDGKH